jgi:methionine-rich copper-binding protein CopC
MRSKQFGALLVAITLLAFPVASANELLTTDPASGSAISVSPSAVTLTTTLPLMTDGNSIEVNDPTGARVDDGTLAIVDNEAIVGLIPLKVGGYYTVTYLLLAENDIPLQGSYRFNFVAPSVISSESPSPTASESTTAGQPSASSSKGTDALVIFLLILSFVVLVGLGMYARKIFNER